MSTASSTDSIRLIGIYLRDHHAASMGGLTLARRAWKSNLGTPLGATLAEIIEEIEHERDVLAAVLDHFGVKPSRLKLGVSRAAVEAGRLKWNGRVARRSPLSEVLELEGLMAGIQAKHRLWDALAALLGPDALAAPEWTYRALAIRAESQGERLVPHHRDAARAAFQGAVPAPGDAASASTQPVGGAVR